jgi:regulatory protein
VTGLQAQVRDPERVSVFIDGSFALGVARDVVEAAGLAVGTTLDEAALAALVASEERHKAVATALNFLAYRPRSEGEIRTRLRRGGFPDEVIEYTLERLRGWRYVDDEDFARRWIENRSQHRPRGKRMLAAELRTKGVDPAVASEAIADAGLDEEGDALELGRQRARQLADLAPEVRERRLGGFLARRGYGFDIIRRVLATLREEAGEDPDDLGPTGEETLTDP